MIHASEQVKPTCSSDRVWRDRGDMERHDMPLGLSPYISAGAARHWSGTPVGTWARAGSQVWPCCEAREPS
jgi:hypothetical protein